MECEYWVSAPVAERPEQAGPDAWGVTWNLEEGAEGGTYPARDGHVVTDLHRWREQVAIPDVDALDWSHLVGRHRLGDERPLAEVDRAESIVTGITGFGAFERSWLLLGMEQALIAYVTETDLMEELAAAIADYKIRLIERFDDEADLDMVWYGDDWGTQKGLFIPPDIWRRTVGKHTQRVCDAIKRRGLLINLHSDGKIDDIFGDVVNMGADIWNPAQPCNDLAMLKRKYGRRITFCGAIDSQFVLDRPGVTPDEVRAEVRKRIDELAPGGGYIAGPSHSVPYRQDILDAMNDEIDTYGRRFYRKR